MESRLPLVVVGMDGSVGALAALGHALAETVRRQGRLRVVTAFRHPDYLAEFYRVVTPPSVPEIARFTDETVRSVVESAVAEMGPDVADVPFAVQSVCGHAAQVLVDASRDADLLVVGHRGRGGVAGALLGSVGWHAVAHAACPVTVVRRR